MATRNGFSYYIGIIDVRIDSRIGEKKLYDFGMATV
jgi:hypothetical protein